MGATLFFAWMYFVQSFGDPTAGLIAQPVRSLLKEWGETPSAMAGFMAILALPWSFKPLFGLLSDFVPLFGSRRRNYLLAATAAAGLGLLVIAYVPLSSDSRWLLMLLLLLPTIGIAFGDVLVDALMIEKGQPAGLTGRFQAVQWTAAYTALLLTGLFGGYVAEIGRQDLAFLSCALLWALALAAAIYYATDEEAHLDQRSAKETGSALIGALRTPSFLVISAILFLWSFNPMWVSVLYLHITETLGYSEQAYGNTYAWFSGGCIIGSLAYGLYCRIVRLGWLVHGSIVTGALANLIYWDIGSLNAAYAVSFAAGAAYITGMLIQLDLAARIVPARAAATLFATLMALTNLAASASEALGGWLFETIAASSNSMDAFHVVVLVSVGFASSCWLLVPALKRHEPEWWRS